ncbi:hypothetical protein GCM10007874_44290 [Labrys miyagiensis]|uniref:Carboxypeptidase regulatory-like domain-containing protein n=1 Tax=Labrys miyagiensis TaxID=346912 RepID=A0ABQ6CP88_9HYPH|nr:hypothetical protein [Labrys miyagiensis]GLS21412.1 hypothetical protein GCM10007874_44290 [Labrys miyagiensis]
MIFDRPFRALVASTCFLALSLPALAQTETPAPAQSPSPAPPSVAPNTAPAQIAPAVDPATLRSVTLAAAFTDKGGQITSGLKWRVFHIEAAGADAVKVTESDDPTPKFMLPPGRYVVHAAYGLAAITKEITVAKQALEDTLVIKAGGLQVEASVLDKPIPAAQLTARIMLIQPTGERRLIAEGVSATTIIRLPEGRYYVECTYGDSNAAVSAEISITAGKLTEATFHQMAASLTLKLVSQPGGEAIANTAWSVLTPGGDVIRESIGAFPSLILAEGNYTVVARHEGRVYTREFDVKAGEDGDVEVVAR